MDVEPEVGMRRAFAFAGSAGHVTDVEPPPDAVWTVEEWDGGRWRTVGKVRGPAARDRMLGQAGG